MSTLRRRRLASSYSASAIGRIRTSRHAIQRRIGAVSSSASPSSNVAHASRPRPFSKSMVFLQFLRGRLETLPTMPNRTFGSRTPRPRGDVRRNASSRISPSRHSRQRSYERDTPRTADGTLRRRSGRGRFVRRTIASPQEVAHEPIETDLCERIRLLSLRTKARLDRFVRESPRPQRPSPRARSQRTGHRACPPAPLAASRGMPLGSISSSSSTTS